MQRIKGALMLDKTFYKVKENAHNGYTQLVF